MADLDTEILIRGLGVFLPILMSFLINLFTNILYA